MTIPTDSEGGHGHRTMRHHLRPPHHCLRFSKGTWVALVGLMLTCSGGIITYIQNRSDAIQASDVIASEKLALIGQRLTLLDERMSVMSSTVKKFDDGREDRAQTAARTEQRLNDMAEQIRTVLHKLDDLPTKNSPR